MKTRQFHDYIVKPSLEYLSEFTEQPAFNTARARAMLVAIAWQESRLEYRHQLKGPARGYWQFEQGGGLAGVVSHSATHDIAVALFEKFKIEYPQRFVAIELNDMLACCFARLLLWTDPQPLPPPGATAEDKAWDYYIRNWRPGKPHRNTWKEAWAHGCHTTTVWR